MKKLSFREQILVFASILGLIFLVYWYAALNPLLKAIDKTALESKGIQLQIKQLQAKAAKPAAGQAVPQGVKICSHEEQVSRILEFIDDKCRKYGIDLISLRQSSENNILSVDLQLECNYYQFLGLLNSLRELNTIMVIDSVKAEQKEKHLAVNIQLLSSYL